MKDYCSCCFCKPEGVIRGIGWSTRKNAINDVVVWGRRGTKMNSSQEALLDCVSSQYGSYTTLGSVSDPDLAQSRADHPAYSGCSSQEAINILRHKEPRNMVLPVRQSTLTRDPFPELSSSPLTPSPHILLDSSRSTPSSSPPHSVEDITRFYSNPVSRSSSGFHLPTASKLVAGQDNDAFMKGSQSEFCLLHASDSDHVTPTWTPSIYNKQLVFFYTDEDNYRPLTIDSSMQAHGICHCLVEKNHARDDINWVVVERDTRFNLERLVEDHEVIHSIQKHWSDLDEHRFFFRKDYRKFEPFRNPENFIPVEMVDSAQLKEENVCDLLPAKERYNHVLLQHLFNFDQLPDIQSFCFLKDHKRSWKKCFIVLRSSGLYYSNKGTSKDSKHLVSLCSLDSMDIYITLQAKKTFNSPHSYCICLKRPQSTEVKEMTFIAVDDERSLLCWLTALRLVKYGSKLKENYKTAVNSLERSILRENGVLPNFEESIERVAMDFTGNKGRVVDDPNEALGVAYEEAHQWRKKATARNLAVAQSHDISGTPPSAFSAIHAGTGIHTVQPWFFSGISRQEAVDLITKQGLVDGVFLVRQSQSINGIYVLSLAHNHKVKHCQINKVECDGQLYYSLDGGHTKFTDLIQLVEFYQLNAAGLPTRLTHYVTQLL